MGAGTAGTDATGRIAAARLHARAATGELKRNGEEREQREGNSRAGGQTQPCSLGERGVVQMCSPWATAGLGSAWGVVSHGAGAPSWAPAPCSTHGLLLERAESTQGAGMLGAPFPMLPGGRTLGQASFRSC